MGMNEAHTKDDFFGVGFLYRIRENITCRSTGAAAVP